MPIKRRCAIVLVFDRLGTGFLGPYGNTWIETPAFNRLASRGMIAETMWADSTSLSETYDAYWTGVPALVSRRDVKASTKDTANLIHHLSAIHDATTLVTDDPEIANHSSSSDFHEKIVLAELTSPTAADDIEQTAIGRLLAAASERLQSDDVPSLLWVHCRAMAGPWDAPWELRSQFADEGDPEPPDTIEPPSLRLAPDHDPDLLLGFIHAYAGQVTALDFCLEALLDQIDTFSKRHDCLLAVTSPRGYPLGEHLRVGDVDDAIHEELVHVPFFLQTPNSDLELRRETALCQPVDLNATLRDWFGLTPATNPWGRSLLQPSNEQSHPRKIAFTRSKRETAVRTPAWFLRRSEFGQELFVKPDDRWEVNNVANRCAAIALSLESAADQLELAASNNDPSAIPTLTPELTDGLN